MSCTPGFDPSNVDVPVGHFIGGRYVRDDQAGIAVRRPSDGVVFGEILDATAETVDYAVRNAHLAWRQSGWGTRPPRERARIMRRWADLIEQDKTLAQLEAIGSTRPITEVLSGDLPFTAEAIRFFAEYADKLGGDVAATRAESFGVVANEPYGVIAAITPWNFPLSMASWKCGPALASGNAMVLKPSELTPFSTLRMAELAIQAGMPAGIFNVITGRGSVTGQALVAHPLVTKVSFTGSTRTGALIMAGAAAAGIKPVTLELGGKSPQLVFADAIDVAHVAQCVAKGFTANAGQACVAGTRLIVHRSLAEELVAAVANEVAALRPGLGWHAATAYSPIINSAQAARIDSLVQDGLSSGAEAICGGGFFEGTGDGVFYQPTVLTHVAADMPVVREELFGPVLTVQTFEDEEEGIALADHEVYGLAAGIYTRDIGKAMRATRAIAAGTVWINRYGRSGDMIIPTGGFKGSGIGKDLGRQAMEACMRSKSILLDF